MLVLLERGLHECGWRGWIVLAAGALSAIFLFRRQSSVMRPVVAFLPLLACGVAARELLERMRHISVAAEQYATYLAGLLAVMLNLTIAAALVQAALVLPFLLWTCRGSGEWSRSRLAWGVILSTILLPFGRFHWGVGMGPVVRATVYVVAGLLLLRSLGGTGRFRASVLHATLVLAMEAAGVVPFLMRPFVDYATAPTWREKCMMQWADLVDTHWVTGLAAMTVALAVVPVWLTSRDLSERRVAAASTVLAIVVFWWMAPLAAISSLHELFWP